MLSPVCMVVYLVVYLVACIKVKLVHERRKGNQVQCRQWFVIYSILMSMFSSELVIGLVAQLQPQSHIYDCSHI
jgi:uncharacterized membrane protein YadS